MGINVPEAHQLSPNDIADQADLPKRAATFRKQPFVDSMNPKTNPYFMNRMNFTTESILQLFDVHEKKELNFLQPRIAFATLDIGD